ncbi:MAG: type II CAAX endopeptidase family protein [Candidatus Aquicultor sp.]|nr:type II CAAX endopeptidase family protein [Candidatus Aquicultor sp.]
MNSTTDGFKTALKTPANIILVTLAVTAVAFIESIRSFIWSPFIIVHTALLFTVALYLGAYKFGPFRKAWSNWRVILLGFLGIKIWQTFFQVTYDYLLKLYGATGNWQFDLFKANGEILNQTADKYHSIVPAILLFASTVLIIPIAEELFYRGYVFGQFRKSNSFWIAAAVSSILLAVRHLAHPLFLTPYPTIAAAAWVISAIPIGLFLAYIYEKTSSLWPVVIIHVLLNAPIIPRI